MGLANSMIAQFALNIGTNYAIRLRLSDGLQVGHWTLDLNTGTMIASEGADAIYGVDFKRTPLAEVQKLPLPEYRPMLDKALSDLITRGATYDLNFKIRRPNDGAIVAIHSVATLDKKTNTVFGVIQDTTTQKKAEA